MLGQHLSKCGLLKGVVVNEFCCASVLGACAALENLTVGMQVHPLVIKCGLGLDNFVVTALINLYAKCGELDAAHRAFWRWTSHGCSLGLH